MEGKERENHGVCMWEREWESRGMRERESRERDRDCERVMGWERERERISWEGERVWESHGVRERRSCEVLVVIKLSVIEVI